MQYNTYERTDREVMQMILGLGSGLVSSTGQADTYSPGCPTLATVSYQSSLFLLLSPNRFTLLQLVTRLVSNHKSSIQCIATFQARGGMPWEQVGG